MEKTIKLIKRIVYKHYCIDSIDNICRKRETVEVRHVIIALIKDLTPLKYKEIGEYVGKNRNTVRYACEIIKNYRETEKKFNENYETVKNKVKNELSKNKPLTNDEKINKIIKIFSLNKSIYTCPICGEPINPSVSEYFYCRKCNFNASFRQAKLESPFNLINSILK